MKVLLVGGGGREHVLAWKLAVSERLERLWMLALNRPIAAAEVKEAQAFVADADDSGWVELCRALLASNEFLMRR